MIITTNKNILNINYYGGHTHPNKNDLDNYNPSNFALNNHNHDDKYYIENEVNILLSNKSDITHNHTLSSLSEKSYNSLTDKPDLSSLHAHVNKTDLDAYNPSNFEPIGAVNTALTNHTSTYNHDNIGKIKDVEVDDTNKADNRILVYSGTTQKFEYQDKPQSAVWGDITGTLSNQTDLQDILNSKQNLLPTNGDGWSFLSDDGLYKNISFISNKIKSQQFDAIIAQDGSGDYTNIMDAWNAGCRRLLFRSGEYLLDETLFYLYNENTSPLIWVAEKPNTVKINIGVENIQRGGIYFMPCENYYYGSFSVSFDGTDWYLEGNDIGTFYTLGSNFKIALLPSDNTEFYIFHASVGEIVSQDKIKILPPTITDTQFGSNFGFTENTVYKIKAVFQTTYDILPYINFDNFTLYKGSDTIVATNGNFTQSCKVGYTLVFGESQWNRHHIKIKEIIDNNTIILDMQSLNDDFINKTLSEMPLFCEPTPNTILFDGLEINDFNGQLIIFHPNTCLSKVMINNCVTKGLALIYDGIGFGWFIFNSILYSDVYAPFGSVVFNCHGNGVYINYTPYVTYAGCIIPNNQPNSLNGGKNCSFLSCKFGSPRDLGASYNNISVVGCIYSDGEVFTNLPQSINVNEIVFPDGKLSSTPNGLTYADNDYTPMIYSIGQDKYTWNMNGTVTVGNNIDGYRKVTFTGKLVKVNVTGDFDTGGTVTFDILNDGVTISTHTVTISNFSTILNLDVIEDSLLSISITNVTGVSNLVIELIERS